jgi:hypothetical protein
MKKMINLKKGLSNIIMLYIPVKKSLRDKWERMKSYNSELIRENKILSPNKKKLSYLYRKLAKRKLFYFNII